MNPVVLQTQSAAGGAPFRSVRELADALAVAVEHRMAASDERWHVDIVVTRDTESALRRALGGWLTHPKYLGATGPDARVIKVRTKALVAALNANRSRPAAGPGPMAGVARNVGAGVGGIGAAVGGAWSAAFGATAALAAKTREVAHGVPDAALRALAAFERGVCNTRVTAEGAPVGNGPFFVADSELCGVVSARKLHLVKRIDIVEFWQHPSTPDAWVGPRNRDLAPIRVSAASATSLLAMRVRHRLGQEAWTWWVAVDKQTVPLGGTAGPEPLVRVDAGPHKGTYSVTVLIDGTRAAEFVVSPGDIYPSGKTRGADRGGFGAASGVIVGRPGAVLAAGMLGSQPFALHGTLVLAVADTDANTVHTVEVSDESQTIFSTTYRLCDADARIDASQCDALPYPLAQGWPQRVVGLRGVHALQHGHRKVLLLYATEQGTTIRTKTTTLAALVAGIASAHGKLVLYTDAPGNGDWGLGEGTNASTEVVRSLVARPAVLAADARELAFRPPDGALSVVVVTTLPRFLCCVNGLCQHDAVGTRKNRLGLIRRTDPGFLAGWDAETAAPPFRFIGKKIADWLPLP